MIQYDPGRWSICFAFSLHGSVFPKAFVWAGPCSAVSMTLHFFFQSKPEVFRQMGAGDVGASVLAGFTFILGFLVVFRSQQAYSRWWEGGTLLQQLRGEWFNAFSNLMAVCNHDPVRKHEVAEFQHRLVRLVSLMYCTALEQVSTVKDQEYDLLDISDFDVASLEYLNTAHDRCEVCLQWIQRLIGDAHEKEVIKVSPPILSRVYNQLGNGIVNLNNARKITEFPIPFPLAQMITFMLLVHWSITAFVCAVSVERAFWCGTISFCVVFSFWSINYIAVELEQPFGNDTNDVPLVGMQTDLNGSLIALMDERAQNPPQFNFKAEHAEFNIFRSSLDRRIKMIVEQEDTCCNDDVKLKGRKSEDVSDSRPVSTKETVSIQVTRVVEPLLGETSMESKSASGSAAKNQAPSNSHAKPTLPVLHQEAEQVMKSISSSLADLHSEMPQQTPRQPLTSSLVSESQKLQQQSPLQPVPEVFEQQQELDQQSDRKSSRQQVQPLPTLKAAATHSATTLGRASSSDSHVLRVSTEESRMPTAPPEKIIPFVNRCWCG